MILFRLTWFHETGHLHMLRQRLEERTDSCLHNNNRFNYVQNSEVSINYNIYNDNCIIMNVI